MAVAKLSPRLRDGHDAVVSRHLVRSQTDYSDLKPAGLRPAACVVSHALPGREHVGLPHRVVVLEVEGRFPARQQDTLHRNQADAVGWLRPSSKGESAHHPLTEPMVMRFGETEVRGSLRLLRVTRHPAQRERVPEKGGN
jgi:hypothetical protein